MRRKKGILLTLAAGVLGLALCTIPGMKVWAQVEEHNTQVSFTPKGEDLEPIRYRQLVKVTGTGTVYDGEQKLTVGGNIYELLPGEEKTYRAVPGKGNALKSITYDGEDITEEADEDGRITVSQKERDTELIFAFQKQSAGSNPVSPGNTSLLTRRDLVRAVSTGDRSKIGLFAGLMVLSGGLWYFLRGVQRKRR